MKHNNLNLLLILLLGRGGHCAECSDDKLEATFLNVGSTCTSVLDAMELGTDPSDDDFCRCLVSITHEEVQSKLRCTIGAWDDSSTLENAAETRGCWTRWGSEGNTFAVGDRVEVLWEWGDYYPGRVSAVVGDDRYNIIYDDGDTDYNLGTDVVRALASEARDPRGMDGGYLLHELVEACVCCDSESLQTPCDGTADNEFHRGMIRIVQDYPAYDQETGKGFYTVELDDGRVFRDMPYDNIRPLVVYVRGDKVEVKKCFWNKAAVHKVNPDGTYEVKFTGDGRHDKLDYNGLRVLKERYVPTQNVWVRAEDGDTWEKGFIIMLNEDTDTYFISINSGGLRNEVPDSDICSEERYPDDC